MSEPKRRKFVNLGIYNTKLEFCITANVVAHYEQLCKNHGYEPSDDTLGKKYAGLYTLLDHHVILVHEDHLTYNTISHEIHHAARAIMRTIGIHNEEADAHIQGYLSSQIFKFLNKEKHVITYG